VASDVNVKFGVVPEGVLLDILTSLAEKDVGVCSLFTVIDIVPLFTDAADAGYAALSWEISV
jgi:hypothetical protein